MDIILKWFKIMELKMNTIQVNLIRYDFQTFETKTQNSVKFEIN